jgi:hypothetical protein
MGKEWENDKHVKRLMQHKNDVFPEVRAEIATHAQLSTLVKYLDRF